MLKKYGEWFYPTSKSYNLLVSRILMTALEAEIKQHARGRLVDIGCGEKPLRQLIAPYVTEHIGIDHAETRHDMSNIDLFGTAYHIPVAANTFDSALCNAVLEHLEEPEQALRETCRVLKPGGVAIYAVPFLWHVHEEPRDFYRYTRYGLRYLFEKAGFEIVKIESLSGFWVTFGQLLVYNLYRFHRGPLRHLPLIPALGLLIQALSYGVDQLDRDDRWTWAYLVVARKQAA
jgi:SAM-dependent methyltransferase